MPGMPRMVTVSSVARMPFVARLPFVASMPFVARMPDVARMPFVARMPDAALAVSVLRMVRDSSLLLPVGRVIVRRVAPGGGRPLFVLVHNGCNSTPRGYIPQWCAACMSFPSGIS